MPKIINLDQNGYIKNRFLGFNIRQIQDIIDYSENFNIDSCILFLDFSRAFDIIECNFMFKCLANMNFRDSFIKRLKHYIMI